MARDRQREAIIVFVVRRLREEREKKGLSMNVVAQRAGLSHSMVSLVERDLRNPTLDTLLRITEVLEVELGLIITEAHQTVGKKGGRLKFER